MEAGRRQRGIARAHVLYIVIQTRARETASRDGEFDSTIEKRGCSSSGAAAARGPSGGASHTHAEPHSVEQPEGPSRIGTKVAARGVVVLVATSQSPVTPPSSQVCLCGTPAARLAYRWSLNFCRGTDRIPTYLHTRCGMEKSCITLGAGDLRTPQTSERRADTAQSRLDF
ncbi:hypothetical protein P280DRAFT_45366 [Massarina eburnea CBS 473.64]|uniref:Uncharacterized protein n=1 Tax=Massarina eburnea CBS 473.64 TaxID=1395130 RepID=A0A6A6RVY6_9PLEO|nr:hypothetical protein P280DRAFT_45366 [Massarina eburnea CBS 473.64]